MVEMVETPQSHLSQTHLPPPRRGGYSQISYLNPTFLLLVVGDLATRSGT